MQAACACAAAFCVLIPLYLLTLGAALSLVDDDDVIKNLRVSVEDGAFREAIERMPSQFGHLGHRFDMFSECVGLGINLGNANRSLLYRIAAAPYIAPEGTKAGIGTSLPCADLVKALESRPDAETPYFRFWHGYQAYIRALLQKDLPISDAGPLHNLRICNAVLLYASLFFLSVGLRRWYGRLAPAILLLPLALATGLLTEPIVTVHALPSAWTYLSIALAMMMLEADGGPSLRLLLFCFVSGSVFNFIGMLFSPQLAPAFICFVAITAYLRVGDVRRDWLRMLRCSFMLAATWFCGFATTWAAKWALATVALGFQTVRASLGEAASGVNYASHRLAAEEHTPATLYALEQFPSWVVISMGLALASVAIALAFNAARGVDVKKPAAEWLLLQSPLLIVAAWTEAMRSHSFEHPAFAQRGMMVFLFFPLLGLLFVLRDAERSGIPALLASLRSAAAWAATPSSTSTERILRRSEATPGDGDPRP
ncbi:MAG TPA: hypothetical protein VK446_06560 [Methylocystis sp.]|nr:hypothetical protein [Methylocystis sp.]